ncbi:MAG: UTP--glucose-1-phosphate uridylyltransferase GalU [Myxococcota bacterium]
MLSTKVRKAVIPVAGLGTRLLPVTKAVPKELLPIVDTPAIQVVIEEAIESGIEEIIFITGRGKGAIEDYFDHSYELEDILARRGKRDQLDSVRRISSMVRAVSIRQKRPLGLGHAVLCAKDAVAGEPFVVLLPDDIIAATPPCTRQLLEVYEKYNTGVVSLLRVPEAEVDRYGIAHGENWSPRLHRIRTLVEKPEASEAPSNLAIIGRYVLPPQVFEYLEQTQTAQGGEIQLTDALQTLARRSALIGYEFEGERHDIGDKFGFLKCNIHYALQRDDIGQGVRDYLKTLKL